MKIQYGICKMKKYLCINILLLSVFAYGENITKDEVTALEYEHRVLKKYVPLAEAGDLEALNVIGNMYYSGKHLPRNYKEAFKWFYRAASQGNAEAESAIGFMYDNGEGVKENSLEALRWYRIAASKGNELALFNLGEMYCVNGQLTPKLMPVCYALVSLSTMDDESGTWEAALNMHIKDMSDTEIKAGKELAEEMKKPNNLLTALDDFVQKNWK